MRVAVEPVAGLESSSLQSAWIQRLKTDRAISDEIPFQNLEPCVHGSNGGIEAMLCRLSSKIPGNITNTASPIQFHRNLPGRGRAPIQRPPKGFGSFWLKLSAVKFRKPPLPPSVRGARGENPTVEMARARRKKWLVHGVDLSLEQQHRDGSKDLLVEFASRLDIKEKPTPLGTFHVVERRNGPSSSSPSLSPSSKEKKLALLPCLTPVVCPPMVPGTAKGSHGVQGSTTVSLPQEMMDLETSMHHSADLSRSSSMEANASTTRTISTFFCGNSRYPAPGGTSFGESNSPESLEHESEIYLSPTGKRRPEALATAGTEMPSPNSVKRSRFSVEAAGPWLNRWSSQNALAPKTKDSGKPEKTTSLTQVWGKKTLRQLEIPSAAAMAIVGAAARELQSYSLPRPGDLSFPPAPVKRP